MFYYYTKWKFLSTPAEVDNVKSFHSTWTTESGPKEFLSGVAMEHLSEFFCKRFSSYEEMRTYWDEISKQAKELL
jgi:hypothetical protein